MKSKRNANERKRERRTTRLWRLKERVGWGEEDRGERRSKTEGAIADALDRKEEITKPTSGMSDQTETARS